MTGRETFDARDIWSAAYLLVMGVPLRRAYVNSEGRVRWEFSNEDDRAWQTSRQWRDGAEALVNGPALAQAYRDVARASSTARRDREYRPDGDRSQ